MDGWSNVWTSRWTNIPSYTDVIDTSENDDFAIFTKALRTNQRTERPSYRERIAASKKIILWRGTNYLLMERSERSIPVRK